MIASYPTLISGSSRGPAMIPHRAIHAVRGSVRCWRHRAVFKVSREASAVGGCRRFSVRVRASGMEEILARVVVPLPSYETRDKSPPPPESNSLEFMHFYRSLDKVEKAEFLTKLSRDHGVDHKGVSELAVKLLDTQQRDLATILQVEDRLRYSLTPRYKQLLCHISRVEGGVKFLVDLRADVLELIASKVSESPQIRVTCLFTFSTGARVAKLENALFRIDVTVLHSFLEIVFSWMFGVAELSCLHS